VGEQEWSQRRQSPAAGGGAHDILRVRLAPAFTSIRTILDQQGLKQTSGSEPVHHSEKRRNRKPRQHLKLASLSFCLHFIIQEGTMAGSSRTTSAKRAKERARQEKRQEKLQKRAQRKLEQEQNPASERSAELTVTYNEEGQPEGFNFHDF
jgi:hypothetical protein